MRKGVFAAWIVWIALPMGNAFALGDKPPPRPPEPGWNFQGMWWASPAGSERGWGIGIAQQGLSILATWFTYDADGRPLWLAMPFSREYSGPAEDVYYGAIYRMSGNASRATPPRVGSARLIFTGPASGTFAYTVNGVTRSKKIEKMVVSALVPVCAINGERGSVPNYTDLWALETGSEIYVAHQGDVLFASWFTYRADGSVDWVVMPRGVHSAGTETYSGAVYRTRGPAFTATPWDSAQVAATPV